MNGFFSRTRHFVSTRIAFAVAAAFFSSSACVNALPVSTDFFWENSPSIFDWDTAGDEQIEGFIGAVEGGHALAQDFSLSDPDVIAFWNSGAFEETLKYGLVQKKSPYAALHVSGDLIIERALELRVWSEYADQKSGNAASVISHGNGTLTFAKPLSVLVHNTENADLPAIFLTDASTTTFNGFSAKSSGASPVFISVLNHSELIFKGAAAIESDHTILNINNSSVKVGGNAVWTVAEDTGAEDTGAEGTDAAVVLKGTGALKVLNGAKLEVTARNVFSGNGSFVAANAVVNLTGSLQGFSGKYTQTGGSLTLMGTGAFNQEDWTLKDVALTTSSGNLFTTAASDYVEGNMLQGTISSIGTPFTSIVLTDEEISLAYLSEVAKVYGNAKITYTGQLIVEGERPANITLAHHFGLLDENNNIGLASVNLDLENQDVLSGKKIQIGSISSEKPFLQLQDSQVVLYGTGRGSVTGNLEWVSVEQQSTLEIHGLKYEGTREAPRRAAVDSSVHVADSGKLILTGKVTFSPNASLVNYGEMIFNVGSDTILSGSVTQSAGVAVIDVAATVQSDRDFSLKGGSLDVKGDLAAARFLMTGGSAQVTGSVTVDELQFKKTSLTRDVSMLSVVGSGHVESQRTQTKNALVIVEGDAAQNQYASLNLGDWHGENTTISVGQNAFLILGYDSSDPEMNLNRDDVFFAAEYLGQDVSSVLAVNSTVALSADNVLLIGKTVLRSGSGETVVFGSDSALLLKPNMGQAAFTAVNAGTHLVFEEGSRILVLDPFGTNQLTDIAIAELEGSDKVSLVSANRNVDLQLAYHEGSGWFIDRNQIVTTNFVYPDLQGRLYELGEDFTIESANIAKRFFARVDNIEYMAPAYSAAVIGQATLLPSLLGSRVNMYRAAENSRSFSGEGVDKALALKHGDSYIFGDVQGSYFVSKKANGYLEEGAYRATSESVLLGLAHKTENGLGLAAVLDYTRVSSKTRHSAVQAKGKQSVVGVFASAAKEFGPFRVQGGFGFGLSYDDIDGHLPSSMQLDEMKAKANDRYLTFGVESGYRFSEAVGVYLSPQLWVIPKTTEKIDIGSQRAFELKTKTQTLVEVPVSVRGELPMKEVSGYRIRVGGEFGGSARLGELNKKGELRAVGTDAKENVSQKEFNRWSSFASVRMSFEKANLTASLQAKAIAGDGRIDSQIGLRAAWRF